MPNRPLAFIALAGLLLLAHALFYSTILGFDVVDDAYISFRYALNASRGHGLTFNSGERRVEGYTNFLWTAMFIPCFWLNIPVHLASITWGIFWALGSMVLMLRWAQAETGQRWLGVAATIWLAADGSFALWSVGGLETVLFAFLILGGALAYLREMRSLDVPPLSGAWFALASMTRPEGLFLFGLTSLHQLAVRLIRDRRVIQRQDWLRLGLFLLLWAPWFAFRWRYYGYPLPNTFYAKVALGDTSAQRARGVAYLDTFIRIHLGYALPILALLPLVRRRWRVWSTYFVLLASVYGAYVTYVGGDWSVGRFFVPVLPLFYALLAGGVTIALEWLQSQVHSRGRATIPAWVWSGGKAIITLGLALGLFLASSLNGEKALFLDPFDARLAGRARTEMGLWLRENVPDDTYIAVDAAGQIPFYSDLRALDLYGLNDLNIAHRQVEDMGQGTPGHEKMDMDYVIFVAQPDYIIIYGTAFDWLSAFNYRRVDLPWTEDPTLKAFLGIYRKE